jgi:hypothetical protein
VETGSRQENATKQYLTAFSSEVETGSRQENATKQYLKAVPLMQSGRNLL